MAEGTRLPPQLLRYWLAGPGAAVIRWGEPNDFYRCRDEIQKAVTKGGDAPLSPRMIDGLCAMMHKMATGATPGHAATEQIGKG